MGRGRSDRDWYYGNRLMVSVTPEGVSTSLVLGPTSTEDRWPAESFFCWRAYQTDTALWPPGPALHLPEER